MIFVGIGIGIIFVLIVGAVFVNYRYNKLFNDEPKILNFENGISITLKECPYCGANCETLVEATNGNDTVYAVRCNSLEGGCGSQTGFYSRSLDAVLAWNRRCEKDD